MKIIFYITFFIQILFGYESLSPKILQTTKNIINNIKVNSYSHKRYINKQEGTYRTDCSVFVGYILDKVSHKTFTLLPIDPGRHRPRAKNFYEAIKNAGYKKVYNGWLRIYDISKAQAGDIIAWKHSKIQKKKDTGHVLIIYKKPIRITKKLYYIKVIDSSKGKHAHDSRAKGTNGIGVGTMKFKVNTSGTPIGYYWSNKSKLETKNPIVIGRAIDYTNF